ncbi:DUF2442 domain-containing protein [Desulfovibrio sp. OttesenSCG-928-I05]|nr:DUF2442 domain-containing protein [Desulfovibrio sp. OttesenSCG-928-I05]
MNTSVARYETVATGVSFDADSVCFDLADGRSISAPLVWFPRLLHATEEQRQHWELIGRGSGVHWPDVDEDISVPGLLGLPD